MPVGEGLKPIFGCFLFNVAKAVRKGRDTGLQLWEDSFVSIPISVARYLEIGVLIVGVGLEVLSLVDEEDGSFDVVFLLQFTENRYR